MPSAWDTLSRHLTPPPTPSAWDTLPRHLTSPLPGLTTFHPKASFKAAPSYLDSVLFALFSPALSIPVYPLICLFIFSHWFVNSTATWISVSVVPRAQIRVLTPVRCLVNIGMDSRRHFPLSEEPSGERAPLMDLDQWQSWTLNMLKVFRQNKAYALSEKSLPQPGEVFSGAPFFASLETSVGLWSTSGHLIHQVMSTHPRQAHSLDGSGGVTLELAGWAEPGKPVLLSWRLTRSSAKQGSALGLEAGTSRLACRS